MAKSGCPSAYFIYKKKYSECKIFPWFQMENANKNAVTGSDDAAESANHTPDVMLHSTEQLDESPLQVAKVDTTSSQKSTSARSTPSYGTPSHGLFDLTPQRSPFLQQLEDEEDEEILDHNPEPPPDLLKDHADLIHADNIGDTVFSKSWLFAALMKLIEV